VRERYWHPIVSSRGRTSTSDGTDGEAIDWIIPDGLAWRMYLPLIIYLVEREERHCKQFDPSGSALRTKRRNLGCKWVLLESVADWMDYRNVSSTITADLVHLRPEMASPHERSRIQRLIQRHDDSVEVFCDLSVREGIGSDNDEDEDEWDLMQYDDMCMIDRSQNALFRAGRLLQHYRANATNSTSSRFFILSGDGDFVQRFPEEDGIRTLLMEDLLEQWYNENHREDTTLDAEEKDHWMDEETLVQAKILALQCREDYNRRNDPTRDSKSLGSVSDTGTEEHWTEERIQEGLRNKTLVKGRLTVTKENIKEGVVLSSGGESSSLFINQTKGYFNRAFHHDVVVAQILPKEEWTSPLGRRRLIHIQSDEDDSDLNKASSNDSPPVPSGRVVAIANQSRRQYVATLVDTPMNDESACLVVPMDVRVPKIRIKTNGWRRFLGQRLWVQVDDWEVGSNYPSGRCVEILGPIANLETEITCLLKENQIYLEPFSAAAQACLPIEGHDWKVPSHEISRRRDLRSTRRIFSVDPIGCQDIDDTFHAHLLPNGDVEVGVHIADVTHFLPHDSPLDKEARKRATTFYLIDRRFDMLPSVLSSDLCSLHGNVDRLAVSTIWIMSRDFKTVKDFWYGRTVIRNYQAMTYDQAHNILHNESPDDPTKPPPPPLTAGYPVTRSNIDALKEDLSILTKLSRKLRKDREDIGGAVDLSSGDQGNELKFTLDENHNPVRVAPKKQLEIHQTVAELMIMANTWVAKTIYERFPTCALLRIHQNVDESRFEDLKDILNAGKISFDGSSNMRLADSLKKAETSSKSNSAVNSLFQSLATRAMSEAQYVSTGQIGGEQGLSHYGLGLGKYTHFTSPIRRYADVVVHRQLLLTLTFREESAVRRPPPGFHRKPLESLPESKTISIIQGQGLENTRDEEEPSIGNSTNRVPKLSINGDSSDLLVNEFDRLEITDKEFADIYNNEKVSTICQTLNRQNRMAKLSSFECQGLFLSLYFKDNFEITQAVVTNLRSNGFWAYIPKFDFRAPVYLSDKDGVVQIDPSLLNLEETSGLDPTTGFASSESTRRFPSGSCTLHDSAEDNHLEITLRETTKKYQVRILDVVTVKIFCDDWDTKSRVPQPRIHLIADSRKRAVTSLKKMKKMQDATPLTIHDHRIPKTTGTKKQDQIPSLYEEIEKLLITPNLSVEFRSSKTELAEKESKSAVAQSKISMTGRTIFGDFVNPDTRSAQQEASIREASAAALERRNQAQANRSKQNEYDMSRKIESDVTARMQRLAATKRNTKKGRSK